jgi:hypothetical protein
MDQDTFFIFDFAQQRIQSEQDKHIVLDPTELYDIPPGYIPITTDVEWINFFGVTTSPCWVKGKRLCAWAQAWLRVRNRTAEIAEVKQDPRVKLGALFGSVPLPNKWTDKQLLILATKLDFYHQGNPIAHLLADITGSNLQIWLGEPSIENLAAWLAILVPEDFSPLEQVWQQQFQEHDLRLYYQTPDKLVLLRRWIGIVEPVIEELGKYPLPIPDFLTQEFDRYWEQQLYSTEAKILNNLTPIEQSGFERIAVVAYNIFSHRPNLLNQVKETSLLPYLSYQQRLELSDRKPKQQPRPLAIDASPDEALKWVIESYLPFRRWETVTNQVPSLERISDSLADSFVKWIVQHYPAMMVEPVANSYLNYSVGSKVQNLCQESPILWVVVDGLGWLDHQELIYLLTKNAKLTLEYDIEPRFSILPTKTEYAKWSLYAQLLPSDSSWIPDAGKAFSKMRIGKRYTDRQTDKLYNALKKKTDKLYCWDTDTFDSLYHNQKDWQSLYQVERPHTLEGIAKKIDYCLQQYPESDNLRIVISSDHGQIIGTSEKITHCPPELEPKGRMAIGKSDDPRFVVLECDRYGLPHDISVVKSSASFGSFNYTSSKQIIGSHGGLFPEEVVVGISILRKSVKRLGVIIACSGEGKPGQTGDLEITIDNPNLVPLTNLYLYIREIPAFRAGKPLGEIIPANRQITFKVTIPNVPELSPNHKSKCLSICGKLTFQFAHGEIGSANITSDSTIIINQIFINYGIGINEFL